MTARDFCYWLQGYFEISTVNDKGKWEGALGEAEVACIRNHLNMVFKHEIDPSHGDAAHQAALSALHQGGAAGVAPKPQPWETPASTQDSMARPRC